ncbi:hypothetical protein [Polaribacter sp. SA4-10]|uniref:hypothetical protein n=1 Tax=Polaribacter sp. SA4-10 TaxID=754397 RepID=UPI0012FBB3E4|nr:hypothetical protein [Polaribacter sp. SA4-10]
MKKIFINIYLIFITISCSAQNTVKDSLFFVDNNNYLELKINYENNHRFFFKNEKFITSAFEAGINNETMNHFAQSYKTKILKKFKPKKTYDIKEYLNNNRKELIDSTSKKYDSYKLLLHFNEFNVFIKKNESFIKVKYSTSLSE